MAAPPLSLRGVYESLRVPTRHDMLFSAKAYLAAVLALVVGFSQNLENPYWAVLTVYIVLTAPESGAVRSKALFRFIGTIGGGSLMLAVTGLVGDQLGVLVTATIAIIGAAVFLRQTDRTPANYIWFSGGITAGVVGLTNLMQPGNLFGYATARMGEISLGVLAITAVDSLFWPRPMTPAFLRTLADWRGQARGWMIEALDLTRADARNEARRETVRQGLRDLAKTVGAIDALAVQLPFDVVSFAPRGRYLNLVRRQVVVLIADLAAIEIWGRALRGDAGLPAEVSGSIAAVTDWLHGELARPAATTGAQDARGAALIAALGTTRDSLDPVQDRRQVLERGLLSRLMAFVRDWSDLALALDAVETGQALPARLDQIARAARPVRSTDYLGALLDMAPVVLAMSFSAVLWYLTAWSSGAGALLFSFIGCAFLIGQAQILQSSAGLTTWILTAFCLVFLYQYAILPRVTDFPVLIAVLGCAMLPLGLMMAMSMAGLLICVFTFSFLGLQNAYAADFNQSLQTLSSSLVGLLIAIGSLYVCSYDRAHFATRRLVAAVRRDIVDLARSRRVPARERFLFLAVDRLALYFPAAEQLAAGGPIRRLRMIDDFGIGLNLLELRRCETEVSPGVRDTIAQLRRQVIEAFGAKLAGHADDTALRAMVAHALDDPAIRGAPSRGQLLEALTGMQLALEFDSSASGSSVTG